MITQLNFKHSLLFLVVALAALQLEFLRDQSLPVLCIFGDEYRPRMARWTTLRDEKFPTP